MIHLMIKPAGRPGVMSRQVSNEQEFHDNLKKLGDLYEEGKDCLAMTYPVITSAIKYHDRLYAILKEMRDLCAVQMQHKHWINEN